jgi:hypothetical protein
MDLILISEMHTQSWLGIPKGRGHVPTWTDAVRTAVVEVDCEGENGFELPHDKAWCWHFVKKVV